MAYSKRMEVDEIRRLAFGAIGPTYSAVGTALAEPCRIFILSNITNVNILFSLDGATDHFLLPPGGFKLIDVCTNKVRDDGFFVPDGTVFYARHEAGAPAASGEVFVEIMHA